MKKKDSKKAKKAKKKNFKSFFAKSTSYLTFKQGVKAIFTYKLQFIIIFVLSVLSTLIFTTAMSTNTRLNNDYNQFVKNAKKFSYEYNYQVNTTSLGENPYITYAPTMDIEPVYSSLGSSDDGNSFYNLIFGTNASTSNFNFNKNCGITVVPPSFFNISDDENIFTANWNNKITDLYNITKSSSTGTFSYKPNFTLDPEGSLKNKFIDNINKFIETNALNKQQLSTFLIGAAFLKYDLQELNLKTRLNNYDIYIKPYLSAIYGRFLNWIDGEVDNYFNIYVKYGLAKTQTTQSLAEAIATINNTLNEANILNIPGEADDKADFQLYNSNVPSNVYQSLIYQFLFGKTLSGGSEEPNKTFVGKYLTQNVTQAQAEANPGSFLTSKIDIYHRGFRGISTPLVYANSSLSITNFFNSSGNPDLRLAISSPFRGFNQSFNGNEQLFAWHQLLAANAAGFDSNFINQAFVFNDGNNTSFRFEIMQKNAGGSSLTNPQLYDSKSNQLHIIKGVAPITANEVAVSPQFARANKINIGNYITIGTKVALVSGIGSTAYSFIPNFDDQSIIPNVENTAIIYGYWQLADELDTENNTNEYTYNFITYNHQDSLGENNQNLDYDVFLAYFNNEYNKIQNNVDFIQKYANQTLTSKDISNNYNDFSALEVLSFNKSNLRFNWTLLPLSAKVLEISFYIASAILTIIVLFALFLTITKAIQQQSSQIGILKAMGVKNGQIASTYLSYSFFIIFFAVPIGWVLGILVQWPVSELFQTFFSLNYLQIFIDWRPLIIFIGILGSISIIVALTSAWRLLHRKTVEILNPGYRWKANSVVLKFKHAVFHKLSFGSNFRLSIAASSVKKINIIFWVILITSFLVTTSLILPVFLSNISNSYFKALKYKNSYDFIKPVYNAPLGKAASNYTNNLSDLQKKFLPNEGFNPNGNVTRGTGFNNPMFYNTFSQQTSAIPSFVYDSTNTSPDQNNQWKWFSNYFFTNNRLDQFLNLLESAFGNNIANAVGNGFSLGSIDNIVAMGYHDPVFKNNLSDRIAKFTSINDQLATGLGAVLALVFKRPTPPPSESWQQQIDELLLESVPPFVSKYVNVSALRKELFTFGWNYNIAEKNQDSFATNVPTLYKTGNLDLSGINPNSNILTFNKGLKKDITVPYQSDVQLQQILQHYTNGTTNMIPANTVISSNGTTLYKKSDNTLNIPIVLNHQGSADLQIKNSGTFNQNIRPQITQFQYLNNLSKWTSILKQFWVYDDSDFGADLDSADSGYTSNYIKTDASFNNPYLLNPFNMSNSRFSFKTEYSDDSRWTNQTENVPGNFSISTPATSPLSIDNKAFGFVSSYLNDQKKLTAITRPFYNYRNLVLFIPADNVDKSIFSDPSLYHSKYLKQIVKKVSANQVPQSVKAGVNSSEWLQIRPYDLNYDPHYITNTEGQTPGPLGNLLNSYIIWLDAAVNSYQKPVLRVQNINNSNDAFTTYPGLTIHYVVKGTVDSYDSATGYTDQGLANLLAGYDIGKTDPFMFNNVFKQNNNQVGINNINAPPFQYIDPNIKNVLANPANNFWNSDYNNAPFTWHNANYSFLTEPTTLTTYYSDASNVATGQYYSPKPKVQHGSIVTSSNLLSAKEQLINRLVVVCLSIASFLLFFIVICSALVVLLVTNLFVSQYEQFMVLMKTEGYTKKEVISLTINIFSPFALIAWGGGAFLSWLGLRIMSNYFFNTLHLALPFTFTWWLFILSFIVVGLMYCLVFTSMYYRLRHNTVELLQDNQKRQ